jgi:ABC-type polysaccharide/polyol phosphate transport system ATPase subunit
MPQAHAAIEARGLAKTFRIPRDRVDTLKERALHPFRRRRYDEHRVLDAIDFDVRQGEFFGIVGRNGSGKSTLLKCLAGIYATDAGTIRVAGRLAPFIELGVGFNPDLTARDNVVLNAVMMGLPPREARRRFDEILAFAELEDFVDLKLKNYSSGMQVRLAFSVMVQSQADVYLIDEVLAVGDAAFQQKCFDVFYRMREEGRTIVLVTHAMELVSRFCHRAMHLSGGHIDVIGDPGEVGRRYIAENFRTRQRETLVGTDTPGMELRSLRVEGALGTRSDAVAHGEPLRIHASFEAHEAIDQPSIVLWIENEDHTRIFSVPALEEERPLADIAPGERLEINAEIENPLTSGRYYIGCSVTRGSSNADIVLFLDRAIDFLIYGGENVNGLMWLRNEVRVERSTAAAVTP